MLSLSNIKLWNQTNLIMNLNFSLHSTWLRKCFSLSFNMTLLPSFNKSNDIFNCFFFVFSSNYRSFNFIIMIIIWKLGSIYIDPKQTKIVYTWKKMLTKTLSSYKKNENKNIHFIWWHIHSSIIYIMSINGRLFVYFS